MTLINRPKMNGYGEWVWTCPSCYRWATSDKTFVGAILKGREHKQTKLHAGWLRYEKIFL